MCWQYMPNAERAAYGRGVDNRDEVREFLTSRRARITPEQAGLPSGSRRRVPGPRRSQVATLADVSVDYYGKLERGNLAGVSPAVLEAVHRQSEFTVYGAPTSASNAATDSGGNDHPAPPSGQAHERSVARAGGAPSRVWDGHAPPCRWQLRSAVQRRGLRGRTRGTDRAASYEVARTAAAKGTTLMPDQSGLGDASNLPGGLGDTAVSLTSVSSAVSSLVNDVINAGAGGTVTQGLVDQGIWPHTSVRRKEHRRLRRSL